MSEMQTVCTRVCAGHGRIIVVVSPYEETRTFFVINTAAKSSTEDSHFFIVIGIK